MSFLQAILCHALSFQEGKLLALGGNSGNLVYDVRLHLMSFHPTQPTYLKSSTLGVS